MKNKLQIFIVAVVTILSFPNIIFGQAPALGTAANFVLFSTDGAVSNSGISQLTGNVGTNNGSSTAFGNVNGVMHDQDGASAQCAADLLIAYNQLDNAIPTFFVAPLLGNGDTLIAGVYSISAATTLNLELVLDAEGDANAVFIFQIEGPLSANANSKVKLINGALACNVFWKVEGLVSMASAVSMKGTIIANNAAIIMNTNDTLEGRALSTAGAITIDGVLAYTPIGCGSPVLTGPAAPALGTAICYAIFSSDGPVTNSGVTYVTGDVGSNNGLTTGFDPLLVTGDVHASPDASTAQCSADLLNAHTYLNTLPADIELLYPAQFGNNLVLTPHTYIMNAAVTFTDTLYLNAQGNADAVFVIQVNNGGLTTSTYSKVLLINGTQAKNVYWKIEGAVNINNYSVFNGTIVSSSAITLVNTGVVLNGRALTTNGAINTTAINATMPLGCGNSFPPNIASEPMNQTVCEGSSVSFTVVATGTSLSYQWRKGSTNLVNGVNISGATSSTLTINPATINDEASNYNVIVGGDAEPNDTSTNASLVVNTLPVITAEPISQIACEGSSASFSVTATGTGVAYQWKKGIVDIVGENAFTYTINSVSITDAASIYNVVVSGTCSPSDTSRNVSLTVNSAPSIIIEPMDQIACNEIPVNFSVSATGTGLAYQWRKGMVNLVDGANISGSTMDTLKISPVLISDTASNYNVVITGSCTPVATSNDASLSMCPVTGISDVGNANEVIAIYPNPFTTSITIILTEDAKVKQTELRIYNVLGIEIMHSIINNQITILDTSTLPSGVYYYSVIDNNNTIQSGTLVSQQ